MGMRADDFNTLTPAEFIYAQIGYMERVKQEEIRLLSIHRWTTFHLLSPYLDPKNSTTMESLFPMPWDSVGESSVKRELSLDQRKERVKEILKAVKNEP